MRRESKRAIEAAEDILLSEIAAIGLESDTYKRVKNFKQIDTAYREASDELVQQYKKLRQTRKIGFTSEDDGLYMLHSLYKLKKERTKRYQEITDKDNNYLDTIKNMAHSVYSDDSDMLAELQPQFMVLHNNAFEAFCHKMGTELAPLKDYALSLYNPVMEVYVDSSQPSNLNRHFNNFVKTSVAYKNAMSAFRHEVERIRHSNNPLYAKAIMDSHPEYGEAFAKVKRSKIHGSGEEIHQLNRSKAFVDEVVYNHFLNRDFAAVRNSIFRCFSKKEESIMLLHYGAFLTPLRHALTVYCSLYGLNVDDIINEEKARYKPESFLEKIKAITGISEDRIEAAIQSKAEQRQI